MPRASIASPAQIRSTILAMLAEAHDASPATRERFRRVVSVRKLKDRLGGGDPATLGRAINAVESEIVTAGLADIAMPDIPNEIAELMRQLWHAAVATQLDEVVKLKAEAQQSVAAANSAAAEANMRVDMLREELEAARTLLAARDTELAQARADLSVARVQMSSLEEQSKQAQAMSQALRDQVAALERSRQESLSAAQHRYEGLSKQLLQETAQQRQALQQEQSRLASQLKFAERRMASLEESLAHAEADAGAERDKRLTAIGEANALRAVNASQRAQLDELMRATLSKTPASNRRSVAPSEKPGSKRAAPRRKGE
jgi:chromosome segregation ATPase